MSAPPTSLTTQCSPGIVELLRSVSRMLGMIVIMVGCLVLLGWALDIAILKSVVPGLATMSANSALAFILAGVVLLGMQQANSDRRWRWAARACAATVALIGILTLIEYLFGYDFQIDQLLIADTSSSKLPGRMAWATALCFCLLGIALLLLMLKARHSYWVASAMIFATLVIAWIAVIGYIYGVGSLYKIDAFSTMAIHTTATLLLVGIGMLLAWPERGLIGLASSASAGGMMARRMLPAAIIIPFLFGWLRWQGQLLGFYDTEFGLSLMVIVLTMVFATFIWWNARSLHQLDLDRMRSDAILHEHQARLVGIIGSAMDALISIDNTQQIVMFNTAAEQMFGCTAAAALGQPLDQFIPTRFRGLHAAHINAFSQTGTTSRSMESLGALTGLRADGTEFPIEATISQIVVGGQKLYTAIVRDISERKQADAALRRSELQFAKVFQFSPAAIGIAKQSNGQIIDVNESYYRLLGYHADEVRGRSVGTLNLFVHPEQRTQVTELMRAHGSLDAYELTLRTKSGAIREVLASAEMIELDNEPCILSSFIDITERKRSEQALWHNQVLLRQILDTNPNIIFVKDRAATIILANRALADSYQMPSAELEGHSQIDVHAQAGMSQAELQQWLADDREVIDTGRPKTVLEAYTHRDGSQHWNQTNKFALDLADGSRGVLIIAEDVTARRQAEARLRQQAELLEQSYDAVIVWELAGSIIYWNRAAEKLYGYSREEAIGQAVHQLLKTELPMDIPAFDALLEQHGYWEGELRHSTKAGTELLVESRHVCFQGTGDDEQPQRLVLETNHDITERRAVERALRQSEELFAKVFRATPAALFITRLADGYIIDANESYSRLFGYDQGELIGHSVSEINIYHNPSQRTELVQRLREQGTIRAAEVTLRAKSGELLEVLFSLEAIEINGAACILGIVIDITDRKRAEQALQRAADRIQHLRAIDQAILASHLLAEIAAAALTHIGQLIPSTRVALLMIDMAAQTINLLAFQIQHELQDPPTTPMPLAIFSDLLDPLRQGQIHHVADLAALPALPAFLHLTHAEHLRAFFMTPIIVDGELIALLNVGADWPNAFTTEHIEIAREVADQLSIAIQQANLRTQIEQHAQELEQRVAARTFELAAANQELEAFSYSVSHDLRAPLRAIDGFSRILLEDYITELPDEAQHYFQLVRDNTQQMGHLVDDLLAFARLIRQPINKREVDLNALVRQCLDELRAEQTGRQIDIQLGDLPACSGDPALLKQVWFNLLANALKYTRRRDPAVIEISCQEQDSALVYCVKDNGVGFDMRYISKLFGVFQRMHRAEDYEGTGVGLAIVQRIVHRHGGRVWAEAAVDRGAAFYFTLEGDSI